MCKEGVIGQEIGEGLVKMWGLDLVTDIKIHLPLDDMAKVTIEGFITLEQGEGLKSLLAEYSLVKTSEVEEPENE